jgi:hypothetical protein
VQAVDDVQLGELLALHLLGLGDGLLDPHGVRGLLAGLALERAVRAGGAAHVGEVQVPVDVEHHPIAVELGTPVVCEAAEPREVVAPVQRDAVTAGEPLAGIHLLLELALASGVHAPGAPSPRRWSSDRDYVNRSDPPSRAPTAPFPFARI